MGDLEAETLTTRPHTSFVEFLDILLLRSRKFNDIFYEINGVREFLDILLLESMEYYVGVFVLESREYKEHY